MKVWVVIKNGGLDSVFLTEEGARNHQKNLIMKWNLTHIYEMEVQEI